MPEINTNQIRQSVFSGMLIGIGDIINLSSDNRYMGALLFSFALLTIIQNSLPLYTGKIGFIRENKGKGLLQILLFNLLGSAIPVCMFLFCKKDMQGVMRKASDAKFSNGFLQLFFLAALCGVLMLVAVYSKKEVITIFCIMIFILSGYEHCIADFPFLLLHLNVERVMKFLCIVLGNSAGSIIAYELAVERAHLAGTGRGEKA